MTAVWAGSAFLLAVAFGWRLAALIGLGVVALWLVKGRRREVIPACIVILAAVGGAWRAPVATQDTIPWPALVGPALVGPALEGTVLTPPAVSGRSQAFLVRLAGDGGTPASPLDAAPTACVTAAPYPVVGLGDRVRFTGTPRPLSDQAIATRAFMRSRGCAVSLFAESFTIAAPGDGWRRLLAGGRARVSQAVQLAAPGDAGALLSGLVTGDDSTLSRQRQDAFVRTGTTHITAVSGSNVALIVAMLTAAGGTTGWRRRLGWQALAVAVIWLYAIAVGGEPPVLRAALVATGALLAVRFGRRADAVTLIFVAATAMVAINPSQIHSLSFQLSFAASLGIVLALAQPPTGRVAWLQAGLTATLAAQIATLPVLWVVLGQVSLTSLIANLVVAPLVALAFPLAFAVSVAAVLWQPLGIVVALPARLLVEAVFGIVDRLGGAAGSLVSVGESTPALALLLTMLTALALAPLSRDANRRWQRLVLARRGP